jgi:predicted kinase
MNKLYMLVGVPGSGKSTWVKNQVWADDCVIIGTDHFVESYATSVGKTYNEVFQKYIVTAKKLMDNQVIEASIQNKDIIWDQTNTTVKSRGEKLKILSDYYKIAVVFPTPERQELDRRIKKRIEKVISQHVVNQMIDRLTLPTKEEGFDEIWTA